MQYLLLIYDNEKRWTKLGKPDYGSELEEYRSFGKEFANAIQGGNALQPTVTAKTVRVRNGEPLATDGPFAETKEQLAGYYLVEASDVKEAVGVAAKIPGARYGSIEVRPILNFCRLGRLSCRFPGSRTSLGMNAPSTGVDTLN